LKKEKANCVPAAAVIHFFLKNFFGGNKVKISFKEKILFFGSIKILFFLFFGLIVITLKF
jgi:hypothetical protein